MASFSKNALIRYVDRQEYERTAIESIWRREPGVRARQHMDTRQIEAAKQASTFLNSDAWRIQGHQWSTEGGN